MLTQKQIKLVENSWGLVLHHSLEVGVSFYKKLFEADPSLRGMFKGDIKIQARKLIDMITFAVHKLHNLDEMITDVQALGVKHRDHFVQAQHYPIVAETLLCTLEKFLGNQWNEEVRDAWAAVYNTLSKIMIEAAEEVN